MCSLGHLRLCTYAHTHGQGSQPLCRCGTPQPSRQAWERTILGAILITNQPWDVKILPFLHQALQGTSDFTRKTPAAQLAMWKQPKPLLRGIPGPPASPCWWQDRPGCESPQERKAGQRRVPPSPHSDVGQKVPRQWGQACRWLLVAGKGGCERLCNDTIWLGEGEHQHALSKWVIASLVNSLGLEPVRRADIGSSVLKLYHLRERK